MPLNTHCFVKEPVRKGYMLYDSNYMTFWNRQNYRNVKRSVIVRGFRGGGEGRISGTQKIFREVKLFCMIQ